MSPQAAVPNNRKAAVMPSKASKKKFMMIGAGKVVHTVSTKRTDMTKGSTGSQCQVVRKSWVSGKITGKTKTLSPEAALALDSCTRCDTHQWAALAVEESMSPEDRKAKATEVRNDTLERAKPKTKGEAKKKAAKQKVKKPPKAKAKAKAPKEKKERKPSKTKAGTRSVATGDGDPAQSKGLQLVEFAKENGWSATLEKDGSHWRATAVRGEETINVWYIDGKYDTARPAETVVGTWRGKLRGAHSARRQIAGEGRDRPHPEPGKGRSGPRAKVADEVPEDESPEDAAKRVPFLQDDDALVIVDAIKGKTIHWRNTTANRIEQARVPSKAGKRTKIDDHPTKPGRRILSFCEVVGADDQGRDVLGAERAVALSNIIRVVG